MAKGPTPEIAALRFHLENLQSERKRVVDAWTDAEKAWTDALDAHYGLIGRTVKVARSWRATREIRFQIDDVRYGSDGAVSSVRGPVINKDGSYHARNREYLHADADGMISGLEPLPEAQS